METVNLRQNIIYSINSLPSDMLEELNEFLSFLKYKNLSKSDNSKEEILDKESLLSGFRDGIKDIKKLKDGDNSVLYNGSFDDMMRELR